MEKKKKNDDVDVDVAQRERNSIKRYASAFSNILISFIKFLKRPPKIKLHIEYAPNYKFI